MYCTNCGAENADGAAFCSQCGNALQQLKPEENAATPPKEVARTDEPVPDGTYWRGKFHGVPVTIEGDCKWTGAERMNPSQLVYVLSEMKTDAQRRAAKRGDVNRCEQVRADLANGVEENKHAPLLLLFFAVGTPVLYLLSQSSSLIGLLCMILFFGFIFCTFGAAFRTLQHLNAKRKYAKHYAQADRDYQQAVQDYIQEEMLGRADDFLTDYFTLPDYYEDVMGLDYMVKALENHRASTLGQAVNLYEGYREDLRRRGLLEQQLAATREAAVAADRAAAAASAAAKSAEFSAYSSLRK